MDFRNDNDLLPPSAVADLLEDAGPAIRWRNEALELLDQRLLPGKTRYVACREATAVADAIRAMVVRGAPAIGIAAGYGMALAARAAEHEGEPDRRAVLRAARETLAGARPTAVNLVHALARFDGLVAAGAGAGDFLALARALHAGDIAVNRRLAESGSNLVASGARVLTHCNTGTLATGGVGTAFGVIAAAWRAGKLASVSFTETRPWLQGARLNAWEFARAGIPATLMTESAAAGMACDGAVDWLIVGADRIALNGDVVNKVGTAPLARLTRLGGGKVMVVAPFATLDRALAKGGGVTLEERAPEELWPRSGRGELPAGIGVSNPVFDVTPGAWVDRLVTERGVVAPADGGSPKSLMDAPAC